MNRIPIVFCFDKRIVLGASVSIKSLVDTANADTSYDIRIFHSDLSLDYQKSLTSLVKNTNHTIVFHYINPEIFKDAPKSNGSWSEIVYYRFLVPEILKEYDKAIYSDVDVLFKDDLSELYLTNVANVEFAAVRAERNHPGAIGHKYFEENKNEFIFWSGLMLFNNQRFRDEEIFDKLLVNAKKHYTRLKFFDLDLVNITCDNIGFLPFKYCVLQGFYYNKDYHNVKEYEYLKDVYSDENIEGAIKNPAIVHYAGKPGKPWRMKHPYEDYFEYIKKIPSKLRKYTIRDIRKRLFSKV